MIGLLFNGLLKMKKLFTLFGILFGRQWPIIRGYTLKIDFQIDLIKLRGIVEVKMQCSFANEIQSSKPASISSSAFWTDIVFAVLTCKECQLSGLFNCTTWDTKSYLLLPPGPSSCSSSCNLGYYPDDSSGECKKCDESCAYCSDSGSSNRLFCKNNTYLQSLKGPSQCLGSCLKHTYPENKTNICQKCATSCNKCFDDNFDQCTKCYQKFYLLLPPEPSACSDSCYIGYYPDDSFNECKKCGESCKSCLHRIKHFST